jgi:hypothetical protein
VGSGFYTRFTERVPGGIKLLITLAISLYFSAHLKSSQTDLLYFSAAVIHSYLELLCAVVSPFSWLELASYSLYNHRTDHTENISASIVDTCVLSHCIATVATLRFASRRIHWCAVCCSATTSTHWYFHCCFTESLPSSALSSTLQYSVFLLLVSHLIFDLSAPRFVLDPHLHMSFAFLAAQFLG